MTGTFRFPMNTGEDHIGAEPRQFANSHDVGQAGLDRLRVCSVRGSREFLRSRASNVRNMSLVACAVLGKVESRLS